MEKKESEKLKEDYKAEDNDLKAMGKYNKYKRAVKIEYFLEHVEPKLKEKQLTITEFNTNCFRITDGVKIIDFYPKSGKIYVHDTKAWITIKTDVLRTILAQFNEDKGNNRA